MAQSQYKQIGEGIAAELEAVADVGRVHLYQRYAADLSKYLDFFRWAAPDGRSQIRGWVVTRESAREALGSAASSQPGGFVPAGVNRRVHTFLLFGVMGLEDGTQSEVAFQDLVEAVCDRFRDNRALRLLGPEGEPRAATLERLQPPRVDSVEVRRFGAVLCHAAEVRVEAVERITRS
ncbi:MAG: hypothetical protein A3J27_12115 [Candidatus Tectomicrobia bacterium RIFCSPLOWO2_12_FULL_69_37]|nr:MAG: hypothetical protein A3J27_12115 [Candidatus Tectomicrobia bacterium RIFCSPLOWO2_12_FULL_69_37]